MCVSGTEISSVVSASTSDLFTIIIIVSALYTLLLLRMFCSFFFPLLFPLFHPVLHRLLLAGNFDTRRIIVSIRARVFLFGNLT